MDLKQLQSFVAVIRLGSFTKAAAQLYLSQPTVSTHIRQLEEELQTPLLMRSTKVVELTERGRSFFAYAEKILELRDSLLEEWVQNDSPILRLGISSLPTLTILPEVLPLFVKEHPEIRFRIHQSDSQGVIDSVLRDEIDLGIVGMQVKQEKLTFLPFHRDRLVFVTPATEEYRQKAAENRSPAEILRSHPVILRETGSGTQKMADSILAELGIRPEELNVVARLNTQESMKDLVVAGLGVAILSESILQRELSTQQIYAYSLPAEISTRNLYLVRRRNLPMFQARQAFVQFLLRYYQESSEQLLHLQQELQVSSLGGE